MNISRFFALTVVFVALSSSVVSAWTPPPASPPNSNIAVPLNVGTVDQTKHGWIGLDSLSIFNHLIISGVVNSPNTVRYLNFGSTWDASGYGIRDNAGTLEFKNAGGNWTSIQSTVSTLIGSGSQWTTSGGGVYYNGIVGVGTADQSNAKFEVNGTGAPYYAIFSDFTSATLRIGTPGGGTVRLSSDGGQNISLMPGGNLGINTNTPSQKLDVNGNINIAGVLYVPGAQSSYGGLTIRGTKNSWSGINFQDSAGSNYKTLMIRPEYSGVFNSADNAWDWLWTNGTLSAGTVPWANVAVPGNNTLWDAWYGNAYIGSNGDMYMGWKGEWLSTNIQRIPNQDVNYNAQPHFARVYDDDGGHYIDTNVTSYMNAIQLDGDVCSGMFGCVSTIGYYAVNAYNAIYSDQRLKSDVQPLGSTLDKVMQLRPVTFKWNAKYLDLNPNANITSAQIGFIAQDMQSVFPEIVTKQPSGYLGIDYGKMTAVLTDAMQEQQHTIQSQQGQIDALQSEVQELRADIAQLKGH